MLKPERISSVFLWGARGGVQTVKKADRVCGQGYGAIVPANFLSPAADILVGVGLGCLLQISRGHTEVKVSGQRRLPATSL